MSQKRPHHNTATIAKTAWVLFHVRDGVAEVTAVCSTDAKAEGLAHRQIAQELGVRAFRPPQWAPMPTGGRVLIYGRDRKHWHFRIEPWILDAEGVA